MRPDEVLVCLFVTCPPPHLSLPVLRWICSLDTHLAGFFALEISTKSSVYDSLGGDHAELAEIRAHSCSLGQSDRLMSFCTRAQSRIGKQKSNLPEATAQLQDQGNHALSCFGCPRYRRSSRGYVA
ncbi:uncharacterized protein UMAG_01661 [Mycosarcoma maydis]|uniref:Uncharacterized protein n=1 Tax=Mycosarcoma maydis TaxID=5270 RepID=A0A0D1CB50_MYCMD|nr:uncharacterized protein UMAG_01661 [Ustilago maydis 521]KIS70487.1 hypothetical protein UMAG_01661 [Ustilago maydis 521]|eukprot:XP_011387645.1 hypothetical protein UMAG_01661 [Ustilago maydis 521]